MIYSPTQPPGSLPCGTGQLVIHGATGVAGAGALAKLGEREYVKVQINRAVQEALMADAGLRSAVASFRDPRVCYTLGAATELSPESWSFPFEAFMLDGGAAGG